MSSRRSAVYLILIIYSAVYCETSSILNLFKRPSSSDAHQRESEVKNRGSEGVLGPAATVVSVKSDQIHHHAGSGKEQKKKVEESSTRATSRSSGKTDSTARGGGWGWGGGHGHDSNLDLYSLLGGLSFASLLGATIVYLARSRNSGSTVVMMNTTGKRRRRDLNNADEELRGDSLADFMEKLGLSLSYPWWQRQEVDEKKKSHSLEPFKLPLH